MQKNNKSSSNLKRHAVAAAVLPFFIAYIYYLPPFPYFIGLVMVAGVVAMWEFFAMYKVPVRMYVPGIVIGGVLLYLLCIHPEYALYALFLSIMAAMLLRLFFADAPPGSMTEIGPVGIGYVYIAGGLSSQWFLRNLDMTEGLKYIFFLYVVVMLSDSMAYYIGTYMGRRKLCPSISPKKTVEGALGSVLGGILGAIITKAVFSISGFTYISAGLIGGILGVTTLIGDLIESMFKRDAGVKDSSHLLPEHGGMLDKLDGHLVSGPVLYFIVRYF